MSDPTPMDPSGMPGGESQGILPTCPTSGGPAICQSGSEGLPRAPRSSQEVRTRMSRVEESQKETQRRLQMLDTRLARMEQGGMGGRFGGIPGGYPGGNPGGYPGGNPGGYPGGNPGGYPGGNPGGYPGGFQGGFSGGNFNTGAMPSAELPCPITEPCHTDNDICPSRFGPKASFASPNQGSPSQSGRPPPGGSIMGTSVYPGGPSYSAPGQTYPMFTLPPPGSGSGPASTRVTMTRSQISRELDGYGSFGVNNSFGEDRQSMQARRGTTRGSKFPCCQNSNTSDTPSCSGCDSIFNKMEERKRRKCQKQNAARKAAAEAVKEAFMSATGGHNFVACMPQCSSDATFRPPRSISPYGRTRPPPQLTACVPVRAPSLGKGSKGRSRRSTLGMAMNSLDGEGSGCPNPTAECRIPASSPGANSSDDPSRTCSDCPALPRKIRAGLRRKSCNRKRK